MSGENVAPTEDTKSIFRRLKALPENKICFDCPKSNPTWCTIPYGAFVCLDCSGVHRSLGTHLTFIRSSDLDGAWTWKQLRCMQVGGNAKARSFFRTNGGDTSDKNKKYSSRAAVLYKSKIIKLAEEAIRKYSGQTHIANVQEAVDDPKKGRDDFFSKFDNVELKQEAPLPVKAEVVKVDKAPAVVAVQAVTNGVDKLTVNLEEQTILKPAAKISKVGAKKGGKKSAFGGAKKVAKSEFKATAAAAEREEKEEKVVQKIESGDSTLSTEAAARLTYKQIERDQKKTTQNLQGKKAESAARLGMGLGGMRNVTHESDFQEIRQVEASTRFKEPSIMDEDTIGSFSRRKEDGDDLSDLIGSKKSYGSGITEEKTNTRGIFNKEQSSKFDSNSSKSLSQDRYKNAKAISSQDLFGDEPDEHGETPQSRLNKFSGSSAVGSQDLFEDGRNKQPGYNVGAVRDSATRVAGNLGTMAGSALNAGWNAFNQIKDNYS